MNARPVVHQDGTVTIDGRKVGLVYRTTGGSWSANWISDFTSHRSRTAAVAALVRADEGTTDAR